MFVVAYLTTGYIFYNIPEAEAKPLFHEPSVIVLPQVYFDCPIHKRQCLLWHQTNMKLRDVLQSKLDHPVLFEYNPHGDGDPNNFKPHRWVKAGI